MDKTVTIPKKELECLREHLKQAVDLFNSLGVEAGEQSPAKAKKKRVPFGKGVDNYKKLLDSGKKRAYPDHLKKKDRN